MEPRGGCPCDHAGAICGLWQARGGLGHARDKIKLVARQAGGLLLRRAHGTLQLGTWGTGRRMRCGTYIVLGCSTCSPLCAQQATLWLLRPPSLCHVLPELAAQTCGSAQTCWWC